MKRDADHISNSAEQLEEKSYFRKIVKSIMNYKAHAYSLLDKKTQEWHKLDFESKPYCPKYQPKLLRMKECIDRNADFLSQLVPADLEPESLNIDGNVPPSEMDKVRGILRQYVREWSVVGEQERQESYGKVLSALRDHYKELSDSERANVHVLVPGAGLGRLAYDVARAGFTTQGNEFSFHMLLASNFILNTCEEKDQFQIYPWIHSFSNHISIDSQFSAVSVPDVLPSNLPEDVGFSMVAGEFMEVYSGQRECWDSIVTCFFIDTAHDIVSYVDLIHKLLKPNGVWINLGPLLYHFEDSSREASIELTLEELRDVVLAYGFDIVHEEMVPSTYTANPSSMLTYQYRSCFFKAIKRAS